jgi:prolyl-tRNA synthetase
VHIVATGKEDLPFDTALTLATELEAIGISVMLDDRRDASAGVKFKDAELIGNPIIVVVGKALADGNIELRVRASGDKSEVSLTTAVSAIAALLA